MLNNKFPPHPPDGYGGKPVGLATLLLSAYDLLKLARGVFGVNFIYYVRDAMVGVRDKSCADGAHVFAPGHFLFLPYSEGLVYRGIFVAEQKEGQIEFLSELHMACRGVLAYSYNYIAFVGQGTVAVAYGACLGRASGCVIFRIKINYHRLAGEHIASDYFTVSVSS